MYKYLKRGLINVFLSTLLIPFVGHLFAMEQNSGSIPQLTKHKESPRISSRSLRPNPKNSSPRSQKLKERKKQMKNNVMSKPIVQEVCGTITMYTCDRDAYNLVHVAIYNSETQDYRSLSWKYQEDPLAMPDEKSMVFYRTEFPTYQLLAKRYKKQEAIKLRVEEERKQHIEKERKQRLEKEKIQGKKHSSPN